MHIILLGDSIFDNGAYVSGGPDVTKQLRTLLPEDARASLLASDGAVTGDVVRQLSGVPSDATLLVVSGGGNDALGEAHLLTQPARSVAEAVAQLAGAQRGFADRYGDMVEQVTRTGLPTALCTIYDANFPPPEGELVTAALSLFNDVITRAAFSRGLPLIDLRLICDDPDDYANPIEPSVQGGAKIASAIAAWAGCREAGPRSLVIAAS
jgi:GDSL-like Lipase/Acylhydrolase family